MVLQFDSIAPHIQKKIAEQMEYSDLINVFQSSNAGRHLGNIVKYLGTKDCYSVYFSQKGVSFYANKCDELLLSQIKEHKSWPRFCADHVFISADLTTEKGWEIIKDLKEGNFLGKGQSIHFYPTIEALDLDVFNQLLEITNSKNFENTVLARNTEIDPIYMVQPTIQKMETVDWPLNLEDDAILGLKATTVRVHSNSTNLKSTVNTFFKQWLNNDRSIVEFKIFENNAVKWSKKEYEETLTDLPHSTIWTPEIHSSSPISEAAIADIEKRLPSIRDSSFHFLQHGEKQLFIEFCLYSECRAIEAKEVPDVKKELLEYLDEDSYRKLTGLCIGCKEKECTCPDYGCSC